MIFLIKDKTANIYYQCPDGWGREKAEKANHLHHGDRPEHLKAVGVESYESNELASAIEAELLEVYPLENLPINENLKVFWDKLLADEDEIVEKINTALDNMGYEFCSIEKTSDGIKVHRYDDEGSYWCDPVKYQDICDPHALLQNLLEIPVYTLDNLDKAIRKSIL